MEKKLERKSAIVITDGYTTVKHQYSMKTLILYLVIDRDRINGAKSTTKGDRKRKERCSEGVEHFRRTIFSKHYLVQQAK
jgi:hypothetical protein